MIVRKITAEEYRRVRQLSSLAFEYVARGIERPNDDMLAYITSEPERRQDIFWHSQWAAFEDDDRTMMSTFTVVPYRANFDGHNVSMMGIGGVATLPQFRRSGGVRACFEKALPDMYQQGAALSYLYPFSSAFYHKFGYELACERVIYKLELAGMPDFEVNGAFHLLEPGIDLKADIIKVCSAFQKRYNLMVLEEDIEYAWIDKAEPFLQREYTYLYRSADGEPKGVVTYKPIVHEGSKTLDCDYRFYFTDLEGFTALINLLKRLMADHSHVLISLPTDVELGGILPEWSKHITRHVKANGMVRVINAEEVLKMAKMRGSGELVIELSDDFIAENNGRFKVTFEDGHTTSVERTQQDADVVLNIREFSRLICGRYDVADFVWLPDVKLNCALEKAAKVFYRKPMHICRYF